MRIANAALPHGGGTDRVLQQSDFVLIDCGGSLYGYNSDVTRVSTPFLFPSSAKQLRSSYPYQQTFALDASTISEDHLNLWDLVYAAQTAAIKTARNGTVTKDVDHAARRIISEEAYGRYFTHRLGHGMFLICDVIFQSRNF